MASFGQHLVLLQDRTRLADRSGLRLQAGASLIPKDFIGWAAAG
jgi:hypothetical protein